MTDDIQIVLLVTICLLVSALLSWFLIRLAGPNARANIIKARYEGVVGEKTKRGGLKGAFVGGLFHGALGALLGSVMPADVKQRCRFHVWYDNGNEDTLECYNDSVLYSVLTRLDTEGEQKKESH